MSNEIQVPKNYEPMHKLVLCGNTLINVNIPFEAEGGIPLLIGANGDPQIWLNARPPKPGMPWSPIIRQNRTLHPAAKLIGLGTGSIEVEIQGTRVLVLAKQPDGTFEVIRLDLRPLGLNIHGDSTKLMVGTNQLVSNTFQNVNVMVGIGTR